MRPHDQLLDVALQYHDALPRRIRDYLKDRGIPHDITNSHLLGWNGWRITIPIYNHQGEIVFFKLAKDPEDQRPDPKMLTSRGAGVELYGWDQVLKQPERIIICEGEFDRLVLEAQGFPSVTSTGGAATFRPEWANAMKEITHVYACFDRDQAGRNGAMLVGLMIPQAKIIELPEEVGEGGDVTDFFVRFKRNREDFLKLLAQAKPVQTFPQEERYHRQSSLQSTDSFFAKRIERIKQEVSLVEIVEQYVRLRPSGRNLVGRCPFHDDHTPSFVVYPQSGTFHCFGCRAHGDVITFIQRVEGMGFSQTLEVLDQLTSHNERTPQQDHQRDKAA